MKEKLKKIWNFLWKDDSIWSWLVSLALAFILVKFIFFPVLSLVFGTSLPLVVIESSSMHHDGSFFKSLTGFAISSEDSTENWFSENGDWYESKNISEADFENYNFNSGMDKGDIILVYGKKASDLEIGDVIIFDAGQNHPIIHRIVNISEENGTIHISTKGDNNSGQLTFETDISSEQVLGTAILRIPKLGWVKLIFVELINSVF